MINIPFWGMLNMQNLNRNIYFSKINMNYLPALDAGSPNYKLGIINIPFWGIYNMQNQAT